jgi:hypothetical protein
MTGSEIARIEIFGRIRVAETVRALFETGLGFRAVVDGVDHRFPLCDDYDYETFVEEVLSCARKGGPLRIMSFDGDPHMRDMRAVCEERGLSYCVSPHLQRDRDRVAVVYSPEMPEAREIDVDERRRPRIPAERLAELVSDPSALQQFVRNYLDAAFVGKEKTIEISPRVEKDILGRMDKVAA